MNGWRIGLFSLVLIGVFGTGQLEFAPWVDRDGSKRWSLDLTSKALAQGNQPPVAVAGFDQPAQIGDTVVLDGSGSFHPAGKIMEFTWQLTTIPSGSTAVLSDTTAIQPSFTVDLPGEYVAELVVNTGNKVSSPDTVTVSTTNVVPIADAGFGRAIQVSDTVVLDGSGSFDANGDELTYDWTLVSAPGGSGAALDDTTAVRPSFFADNSGDYTFALTVNDGTVTSAASEVTFSTTNTPPSAESGTNAQISLGRTVQLDGSDSGDAEGDDLDYTWDLVARPSNSGANISTPNEDFPELTPDVAGDYLVQLVTDDGSAESPVDTRIITTGAVGPVAKAGGDQNVILSNIVTLDGSASYDRDGGPITYDWALVSVPAGSSASLSDSTVVRPTFTADVAGTYVAQLMVSDSTRVSQPDTVVISTGNSRPKANAGPDASFSGGSIALDASASSDPDNDPLTYGWSISRRPSGGQAPSFSDPSSATPTFTASKSGVYVLQVIVSDGELQSIDSLILTSSNATPIADAGTDQAGSGGTEVQLEGSASSDANSDPLTYSWVLIHKPQNSSAALSNPTASNPTFTPDESGDYVVQLVVDDGTALSQPDTVVITVEGEAPIADAGPDQTVTAGSLVNLDGTGSSDPGNNPLTYAWQITSLPSGSNASLSDPTSATPNFTADLKGQYVIELVVNNGSTDSAPDTVVITVPNQVPTADAGPNQNVNAGSLVNLDGTGSSDPENDPLTYSWQLISLPGGSSATLNDPTSATPSFTADLPGQYVAQLVVNDGTTNSSPDNVTITASGGGGPNEPPVLDPVGNQTVDLGSSLTIQLTASDPNGDLLSFMATPLPLPDNASLDGMTGEFTFNPDETQVGTFDITFMVSDGVFTDEEPVTITVNSAPPGGVTALSGRLLDTNDFVLGVETPIVGATITIINSGITTTSDPNGDFLLSGIPAGVGVFDIDTDTASPGPGGVTYAKFREQITLIADVTNVVSRPFLLPRIDPAGVQALTPGQDTMVSNPNIGVDLLVFADSALDESGMPEDEVSISEVPNQEAPVSLPEELDPSLLITIQPTGTIFTQPLPISFPNTDNLTPGSEVDIYSIDPDTGVFVVVGIATVSSDGSIIETTSGGINEAGWHFIMSPEATADDAGPDPDFQKPDMCVECNSASSTHINSGNLTEQHNLVSYRSFGASRNLRFVYNSTAADPRPVVRVDTTIPQRSTVPVNVSARLRIGGVNQGAPVYTSTSDPSPLSESIDETISQAIQFDATALPTGNYGTEMRVTSHFNSSSITTVSPGRVMVNNESDSPFGAGWTLDGLERLHQDENGNIVLTEGDGSILRFRAFDAIDVQGSVTFLPVPPTSVDDSALESNTEIIVFKESQNIPLSTAISVSDLAPSGSSLRNPEAPLPAGQAVTSHLIHFDPVGTSNNITLSGSVTFSDDIMATIFDPPLLNASDAVVGVPGTIYSTAINRGLDGPSDSISLSPDRRTLNFALQATNGVDQIRVITAGSVEVIDISTFDNDAEGWSLLDPSTGIFSYQASGGTPGGHIQSIDISSAPLRYLLAPPKFLGDKSSAYGGLLQFDRRDTPANGFKNYLDDVTLIGAGMTLRYNASHNPSTNWTRFVVPLTEGAWINNATGSPPSQADMLTVLGDLTSLRLRSDFQDAVDTARLDNFSITVPIGLTNLSGTFESPAGEFSTLAQNADDTFTRKLKDGTQTSYDLDGFITSRVDRNGNTTSFSYDGQKLLTKITDPAGLETTLVYVAGRLSSITDPAQRTTLFEVDTNGDLTRIEDPDGSHRLFGYDVNHRLRSQFSKRSFESTYEYDFHGRNIEAGRPDGSVRNFEPSEVFGLANIASGEGTPANPIPYVRPNEITATYVDGSGNATTYQLNKFGSATSVDELLGRNTSNQYDINGLLIQTSNPNGRIDERVYDLRGNIIVLRQSVSTPLERELKYEYEAEFNQVRHIEDAKQQRISFNYDTNGNLVSIVDPNATQTSYVYGDPNCPGLATSIVRAVSLPEENSLFFTYDPNTCNMLSLTDPLGDLTTFELDLAGNVTQIIDGENQITRAQYDSLNRPLLYADPTTASDPSPTCGTAGVTCYAYDQAGNLSNIIDGNDETTTVLFDVLDRAIGRLDPSGASKQIFYDDNGNISQSIDRENRVIEYQYDELNRLIAKTIEPGTANENIRNYAYDVSNNVTLIGDNDSRLSFTYDLLNRVSTASTTFAPFQPDSTLQYSYDPNGNKVAATDSFSGSVTYGYDVRDQLVFVENENLDRIDMSYDPIGRIVSFVRSNNTETSIDYDDADHITRIDHSTGQSTLSEFTYMYDGIGRRTQIDQVRSLLTVSSQIGITYNLRSEVLQSGNQLVGAPAESFVYDPVGNILRKATETIDAVYDASNRLVENEQFSYQYDLNGNLRSQTNKSTLQETRYFYDAEDRLDHVELPDSRIVTYRYDGLGRRIEKNFDGTIRRYVYDGEDVVLEFDGTNALTARYTHGLEFDDPLVMQRDVDGSGSFESTESYFYHTDVLGSIVQITGSDGTIVNAYAYSVFGELVSQNGNLENPYMFNSREFDVETGLYFYRTRYYSPSIGRFISEDRLGVFGGINIYAFVENSPTNWVDPFGLCKFVDERRGRPSIIGERVDYSDPIVTEVVIPILAFGGIVGKTTFSYTSTYWQRYEQFRVTDTFIYECEVDKGCGKKDTQQFPEYHSHEWEEFAESGTDRDFDSKTEWFDPSPSPGIWPPLPPLGKRQPSPGF